MKLTKARLHKIINNTGRQTRKNFKKFKKILNHTNTKHNTKHKTFNLLNISLKNRYNAF